MSGASETVRVGSNMPEIAEGKQEEEGRNGEREGEDFEKCAMSSSHRHTDSTRGGGGSRN